MKITADGFIWKVITFDVAKTLFNSGALEIYQLRDEDVESLIDSVEALNECAERGIEIGIEVGHITEDQTKKVLRNKGQFVDNLWCVEDVKTKFKCDDDEVCQGVLYDALTNDATMEQIWYAIGFHGEEEGLEEIDGDDNFPED